MESAPQTWIAVIKRLISSCQEMTKLLQHDQAKFSKHDVLTLEQGNKQKVAVLETIAADVEELKSTCLQGDHKNLFDALANKMSHFPQQSAQNEWKNLLNQLKSELEKCYHHIITNRQVVLGNMQQLKNLWDQLMAKRTDTGMVYERTGNIAK